MRKINLLKNLLFIVSLMLCSFTYAQGVSGTVSDASGPLPGANVIVKGTTNGAITDFDGKYTLNNVAADAVIVVSYVGYVSQEVNVGGRSTVNITLQEDASQLDEVVVMGYATQTRADITGSVVSVDTDEALKAPVTNAAEALQGRVSGVNVISAGKPGSNPNISIRGLGSSNSTNPLFIIDGVQTTDAGVLNSINPNDIDQMNVLKDGAASIYGARAANGVIIVTTKSGSYNQEKATLSVDIYTGIAQAAKGLEMLNSQQHGEMLWESFRNDGLTPSHPQYGNGTTPFVPITLNGIDPTIANVKVGGTKWWDEITQVASVLSTSASLSGGTETSKSFMSVGYLNREGILKHTGFKRANVQVNNEFKLGDKIKIGQHLNVGVSNAQNGDDVAVEGAVRSSPLIPVYDNAGNFAGTYSNQTGLGNLENPYSVLYRSKDDYDKNLRVFGDIYASYELKDGLTFKTALAASVDVYDGRTFTPLNPEHGEKRGFNTLDERDNTSYSWTWTNTLNYVATFEDKHNVNAFVGIEAVENTSKGKGVAVTDYFNETPDFYLLGNGFGDPNINYSYDNKTTLYSVFGSANYNFDQKYYLTATLRWDKSSRFAGDNKSDIFPSFSAGWLMSNEDFFPQDAALSRVKLKASYGELGNQDLPVNNPTLSLFSFNKDNSNYVFGNGGSVYSGAIASQIGNPGLVWEKSNTTNAGIELGFLEEKLSASLEYFKIETEGLMVRDNGMIPTTGPESPPPFVNFGTVENKGWDIALGYHDTADSGWSYGIDVNVSAYKNEATELIGGNPIIGDDYSSWAGGYTRTIQGEPLSAFFGRVQTGYDNTGRFTYEDVNGDGTINDDDRTIIGSPHPDFTYGINLTSSYKGFDISAFLNGSQGNEIYNHNRIFDFPIFVNGNRTTAVLDAWTPTNTDASYPALSTSVNGYEVNSSSYFVEDGSYMRLKNLQIGYTFTDSVIEKLNMESFRVYLQGTNLFTITDYSGLDPEIIPRNNTNLGVDYRIYPVSQIYSLGVNIKF